MTQFSYSQVANFAGCEFRWHVDKIGRIEVVRAARPPTMGSAVHLAVAARIEGKDVNGAISEFIMEKNEKIQPTFELIPDVEEQWDILVEDIWNTVPWIVDQWTKWIDLDSWETFVHPDYGPLVENRLVHEENVDDLQIEFVYIPDWVATDLRTGITWLIDWKAPTAFYDDAYIEFAFQKMLYQHFLTEIDVPIVGSRVAQIRAAAPKVPKVNKDGKLSRAAIATTWEVYRDAAVDAGEDPDDYLDMKEKLEEKYGPDYWFLWQSIHRTRVECASAWYGSAVPFMKRMVRMIENPEIEPLRNLHHNRCMMCDYKLLCMETLRGHDIEHLMGFGFQRKET